MRRRKGKGGGATPEDGDGFESDVKKGGQQHKQENRCEGQKATKWSVHYLFEPVDNSSLVFFRIMWGLIMFYEVYTMAIKRDGSKAMMLYVAPTFYGKFPYFAWVPELDEYIFPLLTVMGVAALGVTTGTLYRLSCVTFFFGFTYFFLLEACLYLNHFYLICLMAFVLILLPANRDMSIDSWLLWPSMRSTTMPRWVVWLLRGEQTLVYFYAGVAKINWDWLRAEPLQHWIDVRNVAITREADPRIMLVFAYFMSYGGLFFDLFAGFGLLLPRGFLFYATLASCIFFHTMNKLVFSIGIFPYVMLASTLLYLEPYRLRKLLPWFFALSGPPTSPDQRRGDGSGGGDGKKQKKKEGDGDGKKQKKKEGDGKKKEGDGKKKEGDGKKQKKYGRKQKKLTASQVLTLVALGLLAVHQVLVPLRMWLYAGQEAGGDVAWDELGHRYSWRMKLRDKVCSAAFGVKVNGEMTQVAPQQFLVGKQWRKVKTHPELMIQYGQFLYRTLQQREDFDMASNNVTVHAESYCSLNFGPLQPMMLPGKDLMEVDFQDRSTWHGAFSPRNYDYYSLVQDEYPWNWNWWNALAWVKGEIPLKKLPGDWRYEHARLISEELPHDSILYQAAVYQSQGLMARGLSGAQAWERTVMNLI